MKLLYIMLFVLTFPGCRSNYDLVNNKSFVYEYDSCKVELKFSDNRFYFYQYFPDYHIAYYDKGYFIKKYNNIYLNSTNDNNREYLVSKEYNLSNLNYSLVKIKFIWHFIEVPASKTTSFIKINSENEKYYNDSGVFHFNKKIDSIIIYEYLRNKNFIYRTKNNSSNYFDIKVNYGMDTLYLGENLNQEKLRVKKNYIYFKRRNIRLYPPGI